MFLTPKIVVEPIVVGIVEPPEVIEETIAEVVTAEEDPPAPAYHDISQVPYQRLIFLTLAVEVTVPVAEVIVVRPVEVVTPAWTCQL